jgi:hypothetical protein
MCIKEAGEKARIRNVICSFADQGNRRRRGGNNAVNRMISAGLKGVNLSNQYGCSGSANVKCG